jgi:GNAT superfamily N-acetyltransferase
MLLSHLFEDPDIMAVVRLGDVTVEVHRHLADQQRKRRVSDRRVEDVLRQIHMVPRRQMMALPHGQRFWVYDPKNDTALGYTMISPERRVLRLKTTVPNRPWDSDRPIFDLPGARAPVPESDHMKIDEITLGSEAELFAGGGFLPRIDVDAEDPDIRPLDQRYALWPQRHISDIAREDDAIGEQFSDWETAGILDTQTGRAVAFIAWQDAYRSPFPGAVEIHQVEVDPGLRGQGFARYLYELVRRQHTMLADEDQTPNGARMWVGMQQAGLPVQGYISFGSGRTPEELDAEGEARFSYVEELRKMNARLINPGGRFPVYVFPVKAQGGRLDTAANTHHSRCIDQDTRTSGLRVWLLRKADSMKIQDILTEQGVAEAIDIGSEWMTDTELDQYVPDQLQQQWRELVGYDEAGNVSALWANITGGYEPDANDPEDRANMVRVANKWFAMKRIPNVRFFDVRDAGDELEWLVQIG